MRSIKELLEIMLVNIDKTTSGLCILAIKLQVLDVITPAEYFELDQYIQHNRPSKYSSISAFIASNKWYKYGSYYWLIGKKRHRIKWLIKHIKLNS